MKFLLHVLTHFIMIFLLANTSYAESSKQGHQALSSDSVTTGICGGSTFQSSGKAICCHLDEKLKCDATGECWCELNTACQKDCNLDNSCGQLPDCPIPPKK